MEKVMVPVVKFVGIEFFWKWAREVVSSESEGELEELICIDLDGRAFNKVLLSVDLGPENFSLMVSLQTNLMVGKAMRKIFGIEDLSKIHQFCDLRENDQYLHVEQSLISATDLTEEFSAEDGKLRTTILAREVNQSIRELVEFFGISDFVMEEILFDFSNMNLMRKLP